MHLTSNSNYWPSAPYFLLLTTDRWPLASNVQRYAQIHPQVFLKLSAKINALIFKIYSKVFSRTIGFRQDNVSVSPSGGSAKRHHLTEQDVFKTVQIPFFKPDDVSALTYAVIYKPKSKMSALPSIKTLAQARRKLGRKMWQGFFTRSEQCFGITFTIYI